MQVRSHAVAGRVTLCASRIATIAWCASEPLLCERPTRAPADRGLRVCGPSLLAERRLPLSRSNRVRSCLPMECPDRPLCVSRCVAWEVFGSNGVPNTSQKRRRVPK